MFHHSLASVKTPSYSLLNLRPRMIPRLLPVGCRMVGPPVEGPQAHPCQFQFLGRQISEDMYVPPDTAERVVSANYGGHQITSRVTMETVVGQVLQTVYALWIISVPILPLRVWMVLGGGIGTAVILRGSLVNLMVRLHGGNQSAGREEPDTVQPELPGTPLVQFLHRNYCLHMNALFAALGADHLGALALLGIGASVDAAREELVVGETLRRRGRCLASKNVCAGKKQLGQWTITQVLSAWAIATSVVAILFFGCSMVSPTATGLLAVLDGFAHLQTGITPNPTVLSGGAAPPSVGAAVLRFGLMTSVGIFFILSIILLMTWKSTEFFSRARHDNFLMKSPIGLSLLTVIVIFMFYLFGVRYAFTIEIQGIGQTLDIWFVIWLFVKFIFIGLLGWSYYGALSILRLSK